MVAYLTKSDASEGFTQIINFLNGSYIKYALTVSPNIHVSCIKQFWTTVTIKQVNDVTRLQALVDKKKVVITKAAIREVLCLDDAEGVDCMPNEEIFIELARMGYEKPSTKLIFYKAFFSSHLVRNVDSTTKFYMYPNFLQLIIRKQVGDLSTHTTKYTYPALTQKEEVDADEHVEDVTAGDDAHGEVPTISQEPSIPSPTLPTPPPQPPQDLPSTSQVQQTPPQSPQVQPQPQPQPQPQQAADFPMSLFQEALDACAALTRRVEHLEYDKVAQALEITKLKRRVKKLEKRNKGRMIAEIDKDDAVVLMDDKDEDKMAEKAKVVESAQVQGRQAKSHAEIYKIDKDHANKVLSMQEDETEPAEVQEVVDVVTTAKLITKVVTAASAIIPAVEPQVPAAILTATPVKVAAAPSRKRKGVEPKPIKKKQQCEMDKEYARKLHAELNKDYDWDVAIDHVKLKAKEDPAVKRYQAIKRKPQTEAQARKNMMMYLKNTKEQMEEEENKALQTINKTLAEKAAKRRKLNEEVEDLKRHLEIMLDEDDDVYTEATLLARKVPVMDYEIIEINNKPYYKIIRADGTHQLYISFLTLLKNFDIEDLEDLWSLVEEKFSTVKPKNFSNDFLLTTLGVMFEKPDEHAQIGKNQRTIHGQAKALENQLLSVSLLTRLGKCECVERIPLGVVKLHAEVLYEYHIKFLAPLHGEYRRYTKIDINYATGGNLRRLSAKEAWETIKDLPNAINNAFDEPIGDMEDKEDNPSLQRIPMEVKPLDYIKLEDLGLNTYSHDLFPSSREFPSVDELEPQPLPNLPFLDVNLGGKRGIDPPINLYSLGSFRMKVVEPLTIHTPPSPHVAYFYQTGVYHYYHLHLMMCTYGLCRLFWSIGEDINQPTPTIATPEAPQMVSFVKLPIIKKGEYLLWTMKMEQYLAHTDYDLRKVILNGNEVESQLDNKDLEQINQDDLEKMDLKWQVAMLSIRVKDCKSTMNSENMSRDVRNAGYKGRENGKRPVREEDKKALVVQDGCGTYDWSYQVEEEATKFALMAFTLNPSSSSSSNSKRQSCSKQCVKSYEQLKNLFDEQLEKFRKANLEIVSYQYGLESIEGQLRIHQQNEVIYEEKIAVLEYDIKDKSNFLKDTQKQLDEALRENEDLKAKLEKFETSSKNLTKLLNSQISVKVKTGPGYDRDCLANDRIKKSKGYHAVPPPLTGNYMPSKPDLSFAGLDDSIYKFKISETVTSLTKDDKDAPETSIAFVEKPKEFRTNALLIQDCDTDSNNDNVFRPIHIPAKIDFVKAVSAVKGNKVTVVKTSAGCVWRPRVNEIDQISKDNRWICTRVDYGHPHQDLKNKGIVDSGCSRHMTGNTAYLANHQKINDGGFIAFGSSRGKITGKASIDESNLWHMRLGHVNFKTMNKLVKGNLVRGIPSKIFENDHTCVACQKGKQHKVTCKAKLVSLISQPLQMLHMDLFGLTSVNSINHKKYCLIVTDDFSRFSWVFFLATKDVTSKVLKPFITAIENQINKKVKVIRCDNGIELKNRDLDDLCGMKVIKREYSNAKTSQQNEVTERKSMSLIEAAMTMLADSLLPITFWAEAVNTACYVLNRDLVTKSHNKNPYELLNGRSPRLDFMRPFDYSFTILNTSDPLGKFKVKVNKGFFVGYSVTRSRPNGLFDIDSLTNSMNYIPVSAGNQTNKNAGPQDTNGNAGTQDNVNTGKEMSNQHYIVFTLWYSISSTYKSSDEKAADDKPKDDIGSKTVVEPLNKEDQADRDKPDRLISQEKEASDATDALRKEFKQGCIDQRGATKAGNTNSFNTVNNPVNAASISRTFKEIAELRSIGIFTSAYDDDLDTFNSPIQSMGTEAAFNNMESSTIVSPIPTHRVHIDHPKDQILGDLQSAVQTRRMAKKSSGAHDLVEAMQEELLQFSLQKVWRLVDLPYEKKAIGTKWVYRNKKDKRGILVRNKARLVAQGHRQEEGIDYDEVFALVARIEAIRIFLAFVSYMGFIVYPMDVKSVFLYVTIEEEVYIPEFHGGAYFLPRTAASTPIKTQKPLVKDEEAADVDVHLYRSMIRSLMYLTASRPDIIFAICACSRFQVTPNLSHLHAVNRIFRYLKGQPKLGLWYPKDSPFNLEAYSDNDYAGANLDRKSTIREYVDAANCCGQVL
uniref:Integrase catalytic domain-containing protein n=1 Tax=Tanacetum cinerariifolium TaxID=118510 RepID=A0A6L2KBV1_TANCI|nr:hypothetical protein [Tanacetum cinerariifolium]